MEFIGAKGTGLLLDTMSRVPKKDRGNGPGVGGGLGKGQDGSVTLDFELEWVVVNETVGFHLWEVEEK